MSKTIFYISMSLDGYLADTSGNVDFLKGYGTDPLNSGTYDDFFENVESIILGYNTYLQIVNELSPNFWVYSGKKTYVITNDKKDLEKSTDEIIFTDESEKTLINRLKSKSKGDIWIAGGRDIGNKFIDLKKIDQYNIAIIPVILGGGIKLFKEHREINELKLVNTRTYNGIVELEYINR